MQSKIFVVLLLAAVIGAGLMSCSNDDKSSPTASGQSPLVGGWEVVSGYQADYIIFQADNVADFLLEYDHGFHAEYSAMYFARGGQIMMEMEDFSVFNYSISNDTLSLVSPQNTIILAKDENAPTKNEWVVPVVPTQEFAAPVTEALDMAWDGSHLWYPNYPETDFIYRISTATGSVVDSADIPYFATTLIWAGNDLWVSSGSSTILRKYDTLTGTTIQTSPAAGDWIKGLAWDGQYIWISSQSARAVMQFDPSTNLILDTIPLDQTLAGMTWANGVLFVCANGLINTLELSPPRITAVYRVPGWDVVGIAFDGTFFWVSLDGESGVEIARISL
jgi:hypothetical protein